MPPCTRHTNRRRPRRRLARVLLAAGVLSLAAAAHAQERPLSTIAFGSCVHQGRAQPFWKPLLACRPDLFIFCGDNIYSDTYKMDLQWSKYQQLAGQPGFQALRMQCPVLAVWDDHDYGLNDSGAEFREKVASRQNFLRFWGTPSNAPRWRAQGIYDAPVYGPPGRRVQVLLLDTRYNRGPLVKSAERAADGGPYQVTRDTNIALLGEAQWHWLERELKKPAEIRLLVSSIQLAADDHHWESWSRLPHERARLLDLLRRTGAAGVIALSGDRHHAELCVLKSALVGYPLYDLTSSGLNMTHHDAKPEPGRRRVVKEAVYDNNFGLVRIDWTAKDPLISLEIVTAEGRTALRHPLRLSELAP
jgi:alkaline phosphatase D